MTALWRNDGSGWGLLVPRGFLDEAALHELVEEAPQLLPLSGSTYHGKGRKTLLPRLYGDDVGLATIWNDNGAYISVWRSVFERRAPGSITTVETALGVRIGTGNTVRLPSDEALGALTEAYRQQREPSSDSLDAPVLRGYGLAGNGNGRAEDGVHRHQRSGARRAAQLSRDQPVRGTRRAGLKRGLQAAGRRQQFCAASSEAQLRYVTQRYLRPETFAAANARIVDFHSKLGLPRAPGRRRGRLDRRAALRRAVTHDPRLSTTVATRSPPRRRPNPAGQSVPLDDLLSRDTPSGSDHFDACARPAR